MNQAMSEHIDRRLALFENNIADQRLIDAMCWFHRDEEHLAINWPKSLNLDPNRSANHALNGPLIGRLQLHRFQLIQCAKTVAPSQRQHQMRRAGVDKRIASDYLLRS